MRKTGRIIISLSALAIASAAQSANIPSWWTTRGLINTQQVANDFAPANIGQLKNVAYQTWVEMTNQLAQVGINPNENDPQVGVNISNYVPKWNGSALVSGAIYDNGNVGIGTTNPAAKLEVAGKVIAAGDVQVGSSSDFRPAAGTIRWNGRGFDGYNGNYWVSLTTGHIHVWPLAQNDTEQTWANMAVTVSVLANDAGEGLSVASVTQPANGTVVNSGTNVVYTPALDFAGTNVFNYVLGSWYGSATGQVTVIVRALSDRVLVQGGTLPDIGNGVMTVSSFTMGKYEVTWGEWKTVQTWALANGYDLSGIGSGCADNHPVKEVNWYDVVKWCNACSEKEGRTPVYTVRGAVYRNGQDHAVDVNASASGYRLPTDAEWEFAARGGTQSHGYTYSGSNDLNAVGWYYNNASGAACGLYYSLGTWPAGLKGANELGLYDMSGNVWEWCFDWYPGYEGSARIRRGGSWYSGADGCQAGSRNIGYPGDRISSFGFRLARSVGP